MVKKYINMALYVEKDLKLACIMDVGRVCGSVQLGAVFYIYLLFLVDEMTYKQK